MVHLKIRLSGGHPDRFFFLFFNIKNIVSNFHNDLLSLSRTVCASALLISAFAWGGTYVFNGIHGGSAALLTLPPMNMEMIKLSLWGFLGGWCI